MIPAVSGYALALDWVGLSRLALTLGIAVCILGGLLRLIFGKGSSVVKAVSSCIHIALIYLCAIAIYTFAPEIRSVIPSLPFVSIHSDSLMLWDISTLRYQDLFSGMLRLFLLAFLVNLLEDLIPRGEKLLSWYFYRFLTASGALGLHTGISILINHFAPQFFGQWAAPILITLWLLIGILGLSKGLLTLIAAVFNPLLGLLFAFFFTNLVGKQITKSIATCLITMAVLYGLYASGITGFAFSQFSAAAFTPSFVIALAALYLFGKFL